MADLASYLHQDLKDEILCMLMDCYGQTAIEEKTGIEFADLARGSNEAFSKLLSDYLENYAIRNLIWKWYLEFGEAIGETGISGSIQGSLMDGWDDKSKSILCHIYQNRHASIEELRDAVCASHYEVLSRI